jgi:hypothetical protein
VIIATYQTISVILTIFTACVNPSPTINHPITPAQQKNHAPSGGVAVGAKPMDQGVHLKTSPEGFTELNIPTELQSSSAS